MIGPNSGQNQPDSGNPPDEDALLVARAKANPEAFGDLYDRYVDPVYRHCFGRLRTVPAAEDATSTTFFRALAALDTFDPRAGPFRTWLFAIATNAVRDHFRGLQRHPETTLDAIHGRHSSERLPDEQAVANDEAARLHVAMAALSDNDRRIIQLRLGGLNGPEIAATLGRNQGASRIAQHRAMKRLRALLEPRPCGPALDGDATYE